MLEVLSFQANIEGWLCDRCHAVLKHDDGSSHGGHEQSSKLNAQFKFITDILPKIDQVMIPICNFDRAMDHRVSVIRDDTNPATATVPVDSAANRPAAVRGLANTGPTRIEIQLPDTDGPTAADRLAEKERKELLAAQNAMPVHFSHSTVTNMQVKFPAASSYLSTPTGDEQKDSDSLSMNGDGAEIDDYFARLKAEQEKEAAQEQAEEEDSDSDDDEDGFEDVMANGGSGIGSSAATPAQSQSTPGPVDDERPVKKIKVEGAEVVMDVDVDDLADAAESNDEEEFEDV